MTRAAVPISVVGLSHHTTPLGIRERVAVGASGLREALDRVRPTLDEGVLLSTCNRTELYAMSQTPPDAASSFRAAFPDSFDVYGSHLSTEHGEAAVRHLFRVAAGVDSLVFGEAEIQGQVRRAWETALDAGTAGTNTSRLFQMALAAGKRVRSETDVGKLPASVSSAAVRLAQGVFDRDLDHCTVLVIGVGEVGQGVARTLLERGAKDLLVANHREGRAASLAERYAGTAVPWPVSASYLAQADIVVSSTSAADQVLSLDAMTAALKLRDRSRPYLLIDLAVPRDIDPQVAALPNVSLYNVDDLEAVVASFVERRRHTQPEVDAIVEEQTQGFVRWLRQRDVAATIQQIRARGEAVRAAELRWALPKLRGLSERERAVVDQVTLRLTRKLMHMPTTRLRAAAEDGRAEEYRRVARDLFDVDDPIEDASEDR